MSSPLFLLSTLLLLTSASAENGDSKTVVKHDDKDEYTFPRWKSMFRLNDMPLKSHAHRAWVDIYVNRYAREAYTKRAALFPIDSIIVKPLYSDAQRSAIARLVIMMKMDKGYDPKNGDWWYGAYDESGMEGWHQGKIKSCIKCHSRAKETDYMFSERVMEDIEDTW